MKNGNLSLLFVPFIYVGIFCLYYILFLNQGLMPQGPLGHFLSDSSSHLFHDATPAISANLYLHESWCSLLAMDFEPIFHVLTAVFAMFIHLISGNPEKLDLVNAMAFVLSMAKLSEFIIVRKILNENVKLNDVQSIVITLIITFCTVLYLPIVNLNLYLPMLSPNILHNPTMILLVPFAISFFYWYIKFYIVAEVSFRPRFREGKLRPESTRTLLFSLLLITATLVKPAFTNVMLLLVAFYYLLHPKRFISKLFWQDLVIFVPSAIIILYQIYIISQSNLGSLAFSPFKVINYYTLHPIIALFQAIEFPLLATITYLLYFGYSRRLITTYLFFSWGFALIAYLMWSLFYLAGPTWTYGNLAWPYALSLTFLYIFSITAFVSVLLAANPKVKEVNPERLAPLVTLGAVNLGFIFFSGVHQFATIFLGGSWY